VRRFMRKMKEQSEGTQVSEADLSGDPWDGCEDLMEEDRVEWFMDFFRRRDARRPERPEDLVTRALAADRLSSRLMARLEAIVREPIHLLDPLLADVGWSRKGSSAVSSPSNSPRSMKYLRMCRMVDEGAEDTAMSTAILSSTVSLASFSSSGSPCGSSASLCLGSCSPARTQGSHSAGKASDTWEMDFIVASTVDEVRRRLKEGQATQDIFQLLTDCRRQLIACQVKRQGGSPASSTWRRL